MKTVSLKAYAKLNLTLDIVGVRPDGYHLMQMLMQSVDIYDRVSISLTDTSEITIGCNRDDLPEGQDNIAYKAVKRFFEATALPQQGVFVRLEKNIPTQAGMAGGSADAAAVLVGLNYLLDTGLSMSTLCRIGEKIGADVPFCVVGGTQLVSGIGERLERLTPFPACHIVVAKGCEGVSTPQAFERFDQLGCINRPNTSQAVRLLQQSRLADFCKEMVNVLEQASDCPSVEQIKKVMMQQGALGSIMTGSGSAVFGIFDDLQAAQRCVRELSTDYEFVALTQPVGCGVEIVR